MKQEALLVASLVAYLEGSSCVILGRLRIPPDTHHTFSALVANKRGIKAFYSHHRSDGHQPGRIITIKKPTSPDLSA